MFIIAFFNHYWHCKDTCEQCNIPNFPALFFKIFFLKIFTLVCLGVCGRNELGFCLGQGIAPVWPRSIINHLGSKPCLCAHVDHALRLYKRQSLLLLPHIAAEGPPCLQGTPTTRRAATTLPRHKPRQPRAAKPCCKRQSLLLRSATRGRT